MKVSWKPRHELVLVVGLGLLGWSDCVYCNRLLKADRHVKQFAGMTQ